MADYEKILRASDVEQKLSIPKKWLSKLPQIKAGSHEVQFLVVDGKGMSWCFCLATRSEGYQKPVLQGEGWLKYVRYHQLQVGDKIILDDEGDAFREIGLRIKPQKFVQGHWIDA